MSGTQLLRSILRELGLPDRGRADHRGDVARYPEHAETVAAIGRQRQVESGIRQP